MNLTEFLCYISCRQRDNFWSDNIRDICLRWRDHYFSAPSDEIRARMWILSGRDIAANASRDFQNLVDKRIKEAIQTTKN